MNCCNYILYQSEQSSVLFSGILTTINCCNYILYQSEQSSVLFSGIFTTMNCCNYILYQSEQSSVLFSGIFTTINCCNYILYQSEQSSVLFSGIFTTINCCNYILYQSEQSSVLFSGIFRSMWWRSNANKTGIYYQLACWYLVGIPVGCVPPALHRIGESLSRGVSLTETPLDRDPLPPIQGTWDQAQRAPFPEGTWDQVTRHEVTSYRDPPRTERHMLLKILPCPKLRLRAVEKNVSKNLPPLRPREWWSV